MENTTRLQTIKEVRELIENRIKFRKKQTKQIDEMMGKQNCGNCKHSNNSLGIVAYHCDLLIGKELRYKEYDDGKVRSYERCHFKPSKWIKR
jgi:hypothetical protein